MIVYGDLSRQESLERCVETLNLMLEQTASADPRPSRVRGILVRAGELEQALFDSPEIFPAPVRTRGLAAARRTTSLAGKAFDRACSGTSDEARAALRASLAALAVIRGCRGTLRVRTPEGFAFYALYFQSYRSQALAWAKEHEGSPEGRVLVTGIRTIGTSLSAVVAAALRARGFHVKRVTVRPGGHPYARRVEAPLPAAAFGIIVDEGPGLSGSSMLAVADAMQRAGIGVVSLFPAHGKGPGGKASESSRRRWREFRSYPADASPPRFEGRSLAEQLWSGMGPAISGALDRTLEIGGGAWRSAHYESERAWPAICRPLERPKLLCASRDGGSVLFKFCGLATAPGLERTLAAQAARRAAPLAALGFAPRLLGETHGYVAWEWVDGHPLDVQDASFPLLLRMGAYIARAALPPLSPEDAKAARERIEAMLRANTAESLGEQAAGVAEAEFRRSTVNPGAPRAGDGHLAPHEWIRSTSGTIVKTDIGGHDVDHTWTGAQPVHWDLAGALEEWDLHGTQAQALLRGYHDAGGAAVAPAALHPYRTAYAAHRAGQAAFFGGVESDPAERERLQRSYERWRGQLTRCLAEDSAGVAG
jgi:hypothetical protein